MADVGLWVDWSGDGFGETAYDDLTQYVIRATTVGGATPEITGASQAGSATFVLRNPDGLFDPDNASGPLYGLLRDGPRVWWGANTDGTLEAGRTVRGRWAGRIVEVSPIPVAGAGNSTPTVELVCEDPFSWYSRVPVSLTDDRSPANPSSLLSFTFAQPSEGYTMVAYEIAPSPGMTLEVLSTGSFVPSYPTASGMVIAGGSATTTATVTDGWTPSDWDGTLVPNAPSSIYSYSATNAALSGTLPSPYDLSVLYARFIWVSYGPATVRQSAYATALTGGEGIFMTFPDYTGSIPSGYVELAMPLQPQTGSWLVVVVNATQLFDPTSGGPGDLPTGWSYDYNMAVLWGGYDWGVDTVIGHYEVTA